jgi:hypothetical protein
MARTKPAPARPGAKAPTATDRRGRVEQVRAVWNLTREQDPKTVVYVLVPALVILVVMVVLGLVIGHLIEFIIAGVLLAVMAGTVVFGRRATATMYAQVEGKPGAAAAVLQNLRGDWRVTPAVGFTRNQDMVHRVIGRPGVVLVAEGTSVNALRQLVTDQKRRVNRVTPDTPTYDLVIGDGEGQVPVRRLQQHLMKLPRNLRKGDLDGLESRMRALGGSNVPLPKGPMPTRVPRGKVR